MEEAVLRHVSKVIVCIWLMASLVISIEFTSYLMDKLIRSLPSANIDTIEELFHQENLKTVVRSDGPLATYASRIGDKAIDQLIPYEEYGNVVNDLGSGLMNGSLAYANNRLTLIFDLIELNEMNERLEENGPQLIDMIHISEGSLGFEPYFAFLNSESDSWIASALNKV